MSCMSSLVPDPLNLTFGDLFNIVFSTLWVGNGLYAFQDHADPVP